MKIILILLTAVLITLNVNAQSAAWVSQGMAPRTERGNGITHDNIDALYITGPFLDSVRFNTFLLEESFGNYATQYDTLGEPVWAIENLGGDGVVFDGASSLYLIDNETKVLTKTGLNGTVIWSNALFTNSLFGSNGIQGVYATGTDVYVTGFYSGNAYFGTNDTLYNTNAGDASWDIFVVKLNSAGQFQWAATAGGAGLDKGYGIYADDAGNVYCTGYFKDNAMFESTAVTSNGGLHDVYIAKYSPSGTLLWVHTYGGTGFDLAAKIVEDDNGHLYTTGRFNNEITFGSTTLYSSGTDAFIIKFDADGNILRAMGISGGGNDEEADLDYEDGNLVFIATTAGTVSINAATHTGLGNLDICLGKMDTTFTLLWSKLYGSSSNDEGSGIVLLNGSTYFTGSFNDVADFDGLQLTAQGLWDIVTGKIDDDLTTGIETAVAEAGLTVYPVPVSTVLSIETFSGKGIYELHDVTGKLVLGGTLNSTKFDLNVTELKKGVYFLSVSDGDEVLRKKISKQ